MINKNSKVGDIVQFFGLPYRITEITESNDPYLFYGKHYKAKCIVNWKETGGAIPDCINEHQDIDGVSAGRVKSKYVD